MSGHSGSALELPSLHQERRDLLLGLSVKMTVYVSGVEKEAYQKMEEEELTVHVSCQTRRVG